MPHSKPSHLTLDSLVSPLNLCRMSLLWFATNGLQTIIFGIIVSSGLMVASSSQAFCGCWTMGTFKFYPYGKNHEQGSPCINYMQYPWGYALPVSHIISTRESYPQYPWGYAVPMSHILSTCEDMQYSWVISSVPVSHILSTREDMHYPWVISSVPASHILSTREDMQYPWVISSVPVSHILSTREDRQYPWVISSVPVSHILSTREDMQYPWVNLYEWRMNETSLMGTAYPHRYCIPSRVLRIWLTGTEDMTHGYCISSRYWGYDSRVLMIWLTGTAYPHGYWGYDSRYCIPWRVLKIWLTGTDDMTHG